MRQMMILLTRDRPSPEKRTGSMSETVQRACRYKTASIPRDIDTPTQIITSSILGESIELAFSIVL